MYHNIDISILFKKNKLNKQRKRKKIGKYQEKRSSKMVGWTLAMKLQFNSIYITYIHTHTHIISLVRSFLMYRIVYNII